MSTAGNIHEMVRVGGVSAPVLPIPEASASAGGAPTIGAADLWRIVKQRKWLVGITFAVLFSLTLGITLVVWKFFPAYPSEAILEMKPPKEPFEISEQLINPEILKYQLETEAQKIKQLGVLQGVLSLENIKQTQFYQWYPSFESCLFALKDLLSVTPLPDSQLVRVRIDLRSKDEAQLIVSTVVDEYLKRFKSQEKDTKQSALNSFKATRDNLSNQLRQKQDELAEFRSRTDTPALGTARDIQISQINELTALLNAYRMEESNRQFKLDTLQNVSDPRLLPVSAEMRLYVEADPVLRYYRQQVENLDIEVDAATRGGLLGAEHKQIRMLKSRRDGYYTQELQRREELLDDLRARQLDELKQSISQLRTLQATIQDQLAEAEAKQRDLDDSLLKYRTLMTEEERLQKAIQDVEEKVLAAQQAVDTGTREGRMNVVQRAEIAVKASRPNFLVYLGGGFVLSVLGALGLAFLRELTDKAVRTPIDVVRFGQVPVLGSIPLIDEEQADIEGIELATRQAPQSLVSEAFRQVRAHLTFSGPIETQRVLLVTSPGPADGKTAVAINLAVTLAHGNQRVLLVDCNFRRPALRVALHVTRTDGLSNVLIGQARLEDVVSHTDLPNLDVVVTGPPPPTPAELLGSKYMREFIAAAREKYDRIIFDAPPTLLVSDALVVATQVDGVILVARAVHNSKGELRRARDELNRLGVRVLGAILNGVQARPGGYYRQQYREFYDYISEEAEPQELLAPPSEAPSSPDVEPDDEEKAK